MAKRDVLASLSEIEKRLKANDDLTEDDRTRILARAKEEVQKRFDAQKVKRKETIEEEYFKRALRDEEKRAGLHGAYVDITIDLAPYAPYIMLDGVIYWHGTPYEEPVNVAATLLDIQARTWEHDNEIQGRRRRGDLQRQRQPRQVRGGMENTSLGRPGQISTSTLPVV